GAADFGELRDRAGALLQREAELQEIVQLVGPDALQDDQRMVIETGKMLREDFLQQNAYTDDAHSPLTKSHGILKAIVTFYDQALAALKDRKSTRLNSSHVSISYAVFC